MPEILKNIKAEDRLKKIRIVSENDDVMGGQPEADGMKENDNNAIFDLACSVMHALAEVAKVDQKDIPQILDALGDSRTAGASQRIVNEVNKLAKAAQTAANQANDKANTANIAAATADKKAVTAQNKADSAYNLANTKTTEAWVKQQKYITALDIPVLPGQIFIFHTKDGAPPAGYIARNGQAIDKTKMPKLFAEYGANMPDDRDRVHRMAGSLAGIAGSTQEDAIQELSGGVSGIEANLNAKADGPFQISPHQGRVNGAAFSVNETVTERNIYFKSSLVVRTANETRVKARIILACNKIQ